MEFPSTLGKNLFYVSSPRYSLFLPIYPDVFLKLEMTFSFRIRPSFTNVLHCVCYVLIGFKNLKVSGREGDGFKGYIRLGYLVVRRSKEEHSWPFFVRTRSWSRCVSCRIESLVLFVLWRFLRPVYKSRFPHREKTAVSTLFDQFDSTTLFEVSCVETKFLVHSIPMFIQY